MATPNKSRHVHVWARIKPSSHFAKDVLVLQPDKKSVNIHLPRDPKKGVVNNQILDWSFSLDGLFENCSQDELYKTTTESLVTDAIKGCNGTIICYGQTGAGKTYTISGVTESFSNRGLIPRALAQLYSGIKERDEYAVTVRASYLEIYNETMFDLLSTLPESWSDSAPEPMTVVENETGVYVKGLSCHLAQTEEEALNLLFEGETNRIIGAHTLNQQSSRSHCIFTVYIESRSRTLSQARYTVSKINFVDLAGSERLSKTNSAGKIQMEAKYINKSLTFLEQVVIALADKRRDHVPFRQTKLTHCLKDSLGGSSNTVLIANVWGEVEHIEETVSTLRFATRMMCVDCQPCVNEVYDPALMCKQMEREIIHLKAELGMHDTLTNRSNIQYEVLSEQQRAEIKNQVQKYLEGSLDEIDIVNIRQLLGVFESFKDFYSTLEHTLEEKLREKYTLIDRTDPEAILSAQKAGYNIDDEGRLVGEVDGTGFGVGIAPKASRKEAGAVVSAKRRARDKQQNKNKDAKEGKEAKEGKDAKDGKEGKEGKETKDSPGHLGKPAASPSHQSTKTTAERVKSPVTPAEKKDDAPEELPSTPVPSSLRADPPKTEKLRPCTPPDRSSAFEDFKAEKGVEINRILIENKEILMEKKKFYRSLAQLINSCKSEIDESRDHLEELERNREDDGVIYNEDGELVIGESEFEEIKRLKELKKHYRKNFEQLQQTKTEMTYCQKLVDQCRLRLIQEFDMWYSQSFLMVDVASIEDSTIAKKAGAVIPSDSKAQFEDELERLYRLQAELLADKPESAPFYSAQISTQRRKAYEMNMLQPLNHSKRANTPPKTVRNRPPNMLQVHN